MTNHESLKHVADHFDTPLPMCPSAKPPSPRQAAAKALEDHGIQLVVLARYMQTKDFAELGRENHQHPPPVFAIVYELTRRQAKERGVKIIGATAHYVTPDLDEGPIIEQNVTRVTHRDSVADMRRKGRDERQVLTHAVRCICKIGLLFLGIGRLFSLDWVPAPWALAMLMHQLGSSAVDATSKTHVAVTVGG